MHHRTPIVPALLPALCAVALLALPLAGCGGETPPPPADDGAAADGAPEPVSSRGEPVSPAPQDGGAAAAAGSITWDPPEGWQEQQPSSAMRMAQAAIPGDAGAAELTVFHFGPGGGGGTEANIQRWIGQMDVAPGTEPSRQVFETDSGYQVTWVEVAGTLKPSMMGTGPTEPQPDSLLLGAVVEGPGGPWFFKATGPEATLAPERDAFRAMLESIRPAS